MATVYDQFNSLTPAEQEYVKGHPHHVLIIEEAKSTAFSETQRRFGINGHNDRSDAFRHCFWSALLSRELGFMNALEFTTAHESSPSNPPNEKEMDLHNNRVGLHIGRQGGSNASIALKCMEVLPSGHLKVIR